ncbi:hypothetical protein [Marinicella litoralis]|nr:hypothetical protein [Marinicella litoralis]
MAETTKNMTLTLEELFQKDKSYQLAYIQGVIDVELIVMKEDGSFARDSICLLKWAEETAHSEMSKLSKENGKLWSAAASIIIASHNSCN